MMIDSNGTRHHLLLGRTDWQRCTSDQTPPAWRYDESARAVTLAPVLFTFPPTGEPVLSPDARRGAVRSPLGHWFWIDAAAHSIRVRWAGGRETATYWSTGAGLACSDGPASSVFRPAVRPAAVAPDRLAGLTATIDNYLVAGAPDLGELLVFDLYGGGAPPVRVPLPPVSGGGTTRPFDLAACPDGGLAVLDRDRSRLWLLAADFSLLTLVPAEESAAPLLFQPHHGPPRAPAPDPALISIDLQACADPIAVEALPDGSFLVLDRGDGGSTVWRFVADTGVAPERVALKEEALRDPAEPALNLAPIQGHDFAFVPEPPARTEEKIVGTLYVSGIGGNQAYALRLWLEPVLTLRAVRSFFPLRGFTGKAVVAAGDQAFYDQGDRWLPIKAMPRPTYEDAATLNLPVLDGKEPGCIWHRICLDACIPPDTAVVVETRAADDPEELAWQNWTREPAPYRRHTGAELPHYRLWGRDERRDPAVGTWELLIHCAAGRYLAVRLTLEGNTRSSPRLRAARVHYPRFSYAAEYLPAVLRQDQDAARFLEEYLANPEGILTTLEGLIANVQALFDVRSAPAEALEWLAGWLGLALDPAWSDYQRRLLIAHAPYFYQRRGTVPGMMQAVMLAVRPEAGPEIFQDRLDYTCAVVRIVEHFATRRHAAVSLGDPTAADAPTTGDLLTDARARAHRFTVLIPADVDSEQRRLVEQIVGREKPAHTSFTVKQFWALFRVGEVRLGIDTALGEGGRFAPLRLGETALAEGAVGPSAYAPAADRNVIGRALRDGRSV